MLLKINKKKNIIKKLKYNLDKSISIFLIGFKNISCNDLNNLRKKINKLNSFITILRNNLFKLAIKDTDISFLYKYLIGPTILCYSFDDINNIIILLYNYILKYKNILFLRSVVINKKLIKLKLIKRIIKFKNFKNSLLYFIFYLKNISFLRIIRILLKIKESIK